MNLKIIYENDTLLVVDKPAGLAVFKEGEESRITIADLLIEQFPQLKKLGEERRYGIVHRLDKDTSGILLAAKTKEQFEYLQEQFQSRNVEKRYLCLVTGIIKDKEGKIETLLGRSPGNDKRKQVAYLPGDPKAEGKREAITLYKILEALPGYTFLEVTPKTGRKHQIRAHLAYLNHPLAGDRLYGYKDQENPKGLSRQFLHAAYLKITLQDGTTKEFHSPLPEDLEQVLKQLKNTQHI